MLQSENLHACLNNDRASKEIWVKGASGLKRRKVEERYWIRAGSIRRYGFWFYEHTHENKNLPYLETIFTKKIHELVAGHVAALFRYMSEVYVAQNVWA